MTGKLHTETRFKGLPLSEGLSAARVCLFNERRHNNLPIYRVAAGTDTEREVERFRRSTSLSGARLDQIQQEVTQSIGKAEAGIFAAQKMILEDPSLQRDVVALIQGEAVNAETAVVRVLEDYEARLLAMDNEYIKERSSDFGEIKRRLLDELRNMRPSLQCADEHYCQRGKHRIVVAEELTPTLTVELDTEHLMGFVTERGGPHSHGAILARALGIPAVSGIPGIRDRVGCGVEILVNGTTGEVIVWPSEETVRAARAAESQAMRLPAATEPLKDFRVMANISTASETQDALSMKAEGIGLYRTEIEVIAAGRLFSEDEMAERYLSVLKAMKGLPVTYRLFDLGSDKPLPSLNQPVEDNPSLGWRGTRLLLGNRDLLRAQARALARVSVHGPIQILYPMIIDLGQFRELKAAVLESMADLPRGDIQHGLMFEVPGACLQAEEILREADFASIGTNDLIQYLFAVDRENERVAYDFKPDRPVFWRLIKSISDAARKEGKPLSVCGEIGGDPQYVARLLESGIRSVSVSARRISAVRSAVGPLLVRNDSDKEEN